ncbi:magnesium-dependent phosphatase-1 [Chytriomyces cf. hyalinus JEL632]|nr:magnesium-dependent phosphatase-1 [Chytriomyces cf. hyalinus JEL632]
MSQKRVPSLIVFDLDGTLWYPEMYMLWSGGGPPFRPDPATGDVTSGPSKVKVQLLGDTRAILRNSLHDPTFANTRFAISSCTDEPGWAQECLALMRIEDGVSVKSRFEFECISKSSKKNHFISLRDMAGVPFEDMIFFDNERSRCKEVASLGVATVYCPDGLTMNVWIKGLDDWQRGRSIQQEQ